MGRPKRTYPLGSFRLRVPKDADKDKKYPIELEYTWNRKVIRRNTNILVRESDWNPSGHSGRGSIRASYGEEYKRLNNLLLKKVEGMDASLAEYNDAHPNEITVEVINSLLDGKPMSRKDSGQDFGEFALQHLHSEYARKKIKYSRFKNGVSGMSMFAEFLVSTGLGTHKEDGIYLGEISTNIVTRYIEWRRKVKKNKDCTINHALTPIIKACQFAFELGLIDANTNAHIRDMRIIERPSLDDECKEFDDKFLTIDDLGKLVEYYSKTNEPRRKDFIEMFLFAFHACGLRAIDVACLQWGHIDFEKKELRKILIKTGKRHIIPLTEPALKILKRWKSLGRRERFVFDLVQDSLNLDDDDALYKARNNAEKCLSQALTVVGEELGFKKLNFHMARHSFAVLALNGGLAMSVVSRLLGHGSTDVTEKVYAKFLPETLASEVEKIKVDIIPEF